MNDFELRIKLGLIIENIIIGGLNFSKISVIDYRDKMVSEIIDLFREEK